MGYVEMVIFFFASLLTYIRRAWVYFIERKNEVLEVYQKIKALVENQCGKRIKFLRTGNGGEYCNYAFESFCENCGFKLKKIVPYTLNKGG